MLSGGQMRRIELSRVLLMNPDIVVLMNLRLDWIRD